MLERLQEQQKVVHGCLCANTRQVKIDPSDHHPAALEEAIFSFSTSALLNAHHFLPRKHLLLPHGKPEENMRGSSQLISLGLAGTFASGGTAPESAGQLGKACLEKRHTWTCRRSAVPHARRVNIPTQQLPTSIQVSGCPGWVPLAGAISWVPSAIRIFHTQTQMCVWFLQVCPQKMGKVDHQKLTFCCHL